jgi:hypothetical protein
MAYPTLKGVTYLVELIPATLLISNHAPIGDMIVVGKSLMSTCS